MGAVQLQKRRHKPQPMAQEAHNPTLSGVQTGCVAVLAVTCDTSGKPAHQDDVLCVHHQQHHSKPEQQCDS